ncbi:MAG: hypothetical protein Q9168_000899 [Polycauliona sp. 1 TL-2023]
MATPRDGKDSLNTRSKIRSYLCGPSPEGVHPHSSDDENSPRRFAHVFKRCQSRTDAASSTVGAASAASSTSRLHLPDTSASSSSSNLDEHDAVKEQIREKVWIDALAAQNHVSIPTDEDKHPDSVKSPIRRRSLYTPGIATRSPEDILRKPPPPESIKSQVDRDYYYNPALPDSSPLARLANLRSPQNGRSTPSELDYSHLGALRLGTLRVTNGAPATAMDTTSYDDCYEPSDSDRTETDGRLTMGDHIPSECGSHDPHDNGMGSNISMRNIKPNDKSIKRKPLPDRSSTPHDRSCGRTAPQTARSYTNQSIPGFKQLRSGEESREDAFLKLTQNQSARDEPNGHDTRQNPPYGSHFNQQHVDSGYSSNVSLESSQIPIPKAAPDRAALRDEQVLLHSPYHHPHQTPRESKPTPYPQAGSEQDTLGNEPPPYGLARSGIQYLDCQSDQLSKGTLDTSNDQVSRLPTIVIDPSSASQCECYVNIFNDMLRVQSCLLTAKQANEVTHMQSSPGGSREAERSSPSIGVKPLVVQKQLTSPDKPRRLQKKRPKSQPPPMHRMPMLSDASLSKTSIPPVPTEIAALHSERVARNSLRPADQADSLQYMEACDVPEYSVSETAQARVPSETQGSGDILPKDRSSMFQRWSRSRSRPPKSPDQSDDEAAQSDIMRSPSWSEYGNTRKKDRRRKAKAERELQKQQKRESSCEPDAKKSRSRFRSRSRKRSSQPEPVPTLTDFGTVSMSLGAGPYDIAVATHTPNHQSARNGLQPHHINMDAERGRHRSHTTVVPNESVYDNTCALPKLDRPRSLYHDSTRSLYLDSRPVPAMAMADLTQRRSMLPTNTNTSMTDKTETMEELIDRLLEAPSSEAREMLLQRMRQVRHKSAVGPDTASQQANRGPNTSYVEGPLSHSQSTPRMPDTSHQQPGTMEGESSASDRMQQHHSMIADASPIMPPLPAAKVLQEQESRRSIEQSRSNTLVAPQTASKTDLWAGSAIQTEHLKAIESNNDWDAHRLAWSRRRKSAGEALLVQNRSSNRTSPRTSGETSREMERPPVMSRAMTAGLEQPAGAKDSPKAFHKPWASSQGQTTSEGDSTGALQSSSEVVATAQAFERRSGRYEGGLLFGVRIGRKCWNKKRKKDGGNQEKCANEPGLWGGFE